jgi:hypothetical protein
VTKVVLFVTYGGGHAKMVAPVVRELMGNPQVHIEVLALTVGGVIFRNEGLPYKGYKDFITQGDEAALAWGRQLAAQHPESGIIGIEEAESIAYLGLCYWDLVTRFGETEAARLWDEKGRHAFLPISILERIVRHIMPDLVVTTNCPKSEHAAVIAAKKLGIPTLSMVDLFGVQHFYTLESDTMTVLTECVIESLLESGVKQPREAFLVTGNPAFDPALEYRGPTDYVWRHQHFPQIPPDAKLVLWTDMPAYWNLAEHSLYTRDTEEILSDLDMMYNAAKENDAYLLIRPHPSQPRDLFDQWITEIADPCVLYAGGLSLYPLLKAVDILVTYTCTTALEAVLMYRRCIQLEKRCPGGSADMPISDMGLAWKAQGANDMSQVMNQALNNKLEWQQIQERIKLLLPQEKAAPKVASVIKKILFS